MQVCKQKETYRRILDSKTKKEENTDFSVVFVITVTDRLKVNSILPSLGTAYLALFSNALGELMQISLYVGRRD